ncbi:MAG: Zn-ribbon domain-containing OB-fold protein [Abditibacteriales bacterium]|nr:Zn-ribbon domain-containing OB-fold protein [Abditibacteriales bacterium]
MTHPTHLRAWRGAMPVESRYTYGVAGERFFREIKDHARLLGTRCAACTVTFVPARAFCERCFAELTEWVEVSPHGVVHAVTVVPHGDGHRVIAFVQLDGADGGLVHELEVPPADARIGMRVEAVFKPAEERSGSMRDILHFRPESQAK